MSGNNLWIGSGDGHTAKHSSDNHIDLRDLFIENIPIQLRILVLL